MSVSLVDTAIFENNSQTFSNSQQMISNGSKEIDHNTSRGQRSDTRPRNPQSRSTPSQPPNDMVTKKSKPVWGSRSVDLFEKIEQIGEGTYGKVFMARNKETKEIVALKKIRMDNEREGFPITAIREIKILKELHHENIVQLKEIVTSKGNNESSIYMVFEYMDHDLTGLMMSEGHFSIPQIKCYMHQLLEGLRICHKNRVLHRDIKGSNLLISNKGQLKLADFGLARPYTDQSGRYTNRVITLWYRPPELLLGAEQYGPEIDMWGAGCILAELLDHKPIFPGRDEFNQLDLIFKTCGTPTEQTWPGISKLCWWNKFRIQNYPAKLRERFKHFDKDALELVEKLLELDPKRRMSAKEALDSNWFWTEPLPCEPSKLPQYRSSHEYQAKQLKEKRKGGYPPPPDMDQPKRPRGPGPQPNAVPAPPPPSHLVSQGHPPQPSASYSSQPKYPPTYPPNQRRPGRTHNEGVSSTLPSASEQRFQGRYGDQKHGSESRYSDSRHPSNRDRDGSVPQP